MTTNKSTMVSFMVYSVCYRHSKHSLMRVIRQTHSVFGTAKFNPSKTIDSYFWNPSGGSSSFLLEELLSSFPALLLSSSCFFSRFNLNPLKTPVPLTSSVCPAAYLTVSTAVLMVQYNTIVGAASRVVLVVWGVVDVVTLLPTNGCEGANDEVMEAEEAKISPEIGMEMRTIVLLVIFLRP